MGSKDLEHFLKCPKCKHEIKIDNIDDRVALFQIMAILRTKKEK